MSSGRLELLRRTAMRGKYARLYCHLAQLSGHEWQARFGEIEKILGFRLPDSARIHRPWWANQGQRGGHSHALAWEMAGWKTSQVNVAEERLVFIRNYAEDELNSIWDGLIANVHLGGSILENTDTKQRMMFRASTEEVTSYRDFDPPFRYHPITVEYTRTRKNKGDSWTTWVGGTVED